MADKRVGGIIFVKVDAEKLPKVASKYPIAGYPTFIFLSATGKQEDKLTGSTSKMLMKTKVDKATGKTTGMMIIKEETIPVTPIRPLEKTRVIEREPVKKARKVKVRRR